MLWTLRYRSVLLLNVVPYACHIMTGVKARVSVLVIVIYFICHLANKLYCINNKINVEEMGVARQQQYRRRRHPTTAGGKSRNRKEFHRKHNPRARGVSGVQSQTRGARCQSP